MGQGKPQYRTLVRALDELDVAALDVLQPFTGKSLGPRMKALRKASERANALVKRAEAAMDEKARKKDANQRRDTSSYTKHRSGEL